MTAAMFFWASLVFASKASYVRAQEELEEEGFIGHADNLLDADCLSFKSLRLSVQWDGSASWSCFDISEGVLEVLASHAKEGEAVALITEEDEASGSLFRPGKRSAELSNKKAMALYEKLRAPSAEGKKAMRAGARKANGATSKPRVRRSTMKAPAKRPKEFHFRLRARTSEPRLDEALSELFNLLDKTIRAFPELSSNPGLRERVEAEIQFVDGMGSSDYFGCELLGRDEEAASTAERLLGEIFGQPNALFSALAEQYGYELTVG